MVDELMSKVTGLDWAESSIVESYPPDQPAWDAKRCCDTNDAFRLALQFTLEQFSISGRRSSLRLYPRVDWFADMTSAHKAETSVFQSNSVLPALVVLPAAGKIYPIGTSEEAVRRFYAGLATWSVLRPKDDKEGYSLSSDTDLVGESHLGKGLAVHVCRTITFTTRAGESGDFSYSLVERVQEPRPTEKFGVNVYPYVRMRLNGQDGIYPISAGEISANAITEKEYDNRKLIAGTPYSDGECQSMPLIPGVHQVHILIEESGDSFRVIEIHCDGDCIFPS